jgi:membrane protein YqaA with SNARE-associated domain
MQQKSKALVVILIALMFPILPFVVVGELPGERWLSASDDNVRDFSVMATGLLVADVLLPIPSSLVITLTSARLGFGLGWLLCWLGLTLGNILGYVLGRFWPARFAPDFADQPALWVLLLSRPVPILAEAMIIAAGAARTNFLLAMGACVVGNALYVAVLAAVGAALLAQQQTVWALVLVMLVPVVGWLLWRRGL